MNQTATPTVDEKVLTRGTKGKSIYGELLQFISSPKVLTFDNVPYDNSQAERNYVRIVVDGREYNFSQQPGPGFNTTWTSIDDPSDILSSDVIAPAAQIYVASPSA